jgi:hypothetical protein
MINVISACGIWLATVAPSNDGTKSSEKPLSVKERAQIRKWVYDGGATALPRGGRWALQEVLVVPAELTKLHAEKRAGTLHLLLDIVKGGRPHDAMVAASFAHALEEDIAVGAFFMKYPFGEVDVEIQGSGCTYRDRLVEGLSPYIERRDRQNLKK